MSRSSWQRHRSGCTRAVGARRRCISTGYGISAEDQARLFTKFFRSSRQEVNQERGTGLGLALTRQMVERLGGTISLRSQLGAGRLERRQAGAERQRAARGRQRGQQRWQRR
ncbi:MAG: hypothetical protein HY332_13920 [Chloroflexi bacterium]|nr:hypothetical protein [Chloroflexota bacterium]